MPETTYAPDPRPQPPYTVPSRNFGKRVPVIYDATSRGISDVVLGIQRSGVTRFSVLADGQLNLNRQGADTQGATIQSTKRGALTNELDPIKSGNGLFQIRAQGWDGAAMGDAGRIQINAAEDFTIAAHGTYYRFQGCLLGSTVQQEVFRIEPTATEVELRLLATKVLGVRNTGWTTFTGTANKNAGGLDTGTATTAQVAQVVKSLMDALILHGLIGA